MYNWYAIESEAEFRRREWEREVAADTRAALAGVDRIVPRWLRLPRLNVSSVKGLALPRLAFPGQTPARQTAEPC